MTAIAAQEFAQFVDGITIQLANHSPTFGALVAAMPGVLPDEALASLRRIANPDASRLIADSANDRTSGVIDQCSELPLPHPLDSEFRFDATTASILARSLVEATSPGEEILLIGVPSVAIELAAMDVNRKIRFLGPDNCVSDAVRAAFVGGRLLLDQGPGSTAAAALLDPPWYAAPMAELIRVCASGVHAGALINLVIPPVGTRPEVTLDRDVFLASAAAVGLVATGIGGPVCYRTPLFELSAMERQGIARLPSWRRGEVVEFRMVKRADFHPWIRPRVAELSVGGIRLRLVDGDAEGITTLMPIADHEVFPSVSARAPGRARATLWTTANRAFAVDLALAQVAMGRIASQPELWQLGFYSEENDPAADQHVDTQRQLIHQLTKLIGREMNDARRLVGDGAWLKTEMGWRS